MPDGLGALSCRDNSDHSAGHHVHRALDGPCTLGLLWAKCQGTLWTPRGERADRLTELPLGRLKRVLGGLPHSRGTSYAAMDQDTEEILTKVRAPMCISSLSSSQVIKGPRL